MADFSAVRDGIAANLATISGLTVHVKAPDTLTGPSIVVLPANEGTFIEFDTAMDGDAEDMAFVLHLFVPRRHDITAQGELDGYLDKTGAQSIYAALDAAAVAGTQYAVLERARDYGDYTYATELFIGCKFDVTVGAV